MKLFQIILLFTSALNTCTYRPSSEEFKPNFINPTLLNSILSVLSRHVPKSDTYKEYFNLEFLYYNVNFSLIFGTFFNFTGRFLIPDGGTYHIILVPLLTLCGSYIGLDINLMFPDLIYLDIFHQYIPDIKGQVALLLHMTANMPMREIIIISNLLTYHKLLGGSDYLAHFFSNYMIYDGLYVLPYNPNYFISDIRNVLMSVDGIQDILMRTHYITLREDYSMYSLCKGMNMEVISNSVDISYLLN